MTKASLALRIIYALCLAGATFVHVAIHLQYGLLLGALETEGFPLASRLFWSSLTLLDPLAVLLLFIRPRVGLVLTTAIIVSDVAHNSWIVYRTGGTSDPKYWAQIGFLVFVLATVRIAWRGASSSARHA
jgi:hypothetical protein